MSDTSIPRAEEADLLSRGLRAKFDAKKTWRKAVFATRFINAANKSAKGQHYLRDQLTPDETKLIDQVEKDKAEAAQESQVPAVLSF